MRSASQGPPILAIDTKDPFAWLRIVAGFVWGGDRRKMDLALATYSSELLGILREVAREPMQPTTLAALAQRLGLSPAELSRMPGCAVFYTSFFAQPGAAARALDERVFEPVGHFRAAAEAPGSERLVRDYAKAVEGGAFHAGVLLLLVAMLAHCHPDVPASLNRALAILGRWRERRLMHLPSERALLQGWKAWRHVAPLWAAFGAEFQDARRGSLSDFAAGLEALQDPARLGRVLGHAKWFRRFATTFVPEHASGPLIPPGLALQIVCDAPEEEVPFAPLPEADVEAARRYQAPTRKFFG